MDTLYDILSEFSIGTTPRALVLIILGYFVARILAKLVNNTFSKRLSVHQATLLNRFVFYLILSLFIASAIQELGFQISALLGATGILTIAIGIASQTSLSNIISGIFIIGEKPFEIGDTIKVNELTGEVLSIDLLSVRIRTNDNTMIRIPNEVLTKSAIINTSYFPIRRIDFALNVDYKENLETIRQLLLEIASRNEHCLDEPKASVTVNGFGDSALNIQFQVWTNTKYFNELKHALFEEINQAFEAKGINIPLTKREIICINAKS